MLSRKSLSLSAAPAASERGVCPLAIADRSSVDEAFKAADTCPFHRVVHTRAPAPTRESQDMPHVPLHVIDGDYDRTPESAELLQSVGGSRRILEMTTRFYAYAMADAHLKEFFFMRDGIEAAAQRLGTWIVQFMGGEGNPWDDLGREGMRQVMHHHAWNSSRRPPERKGRRFKLDDCRVWMRLMFLAAREVGLLAHARFQRWYTLFIAHFIRVYETTAPPFAKIDMEWSADPRRVQEYLASDRLMSDVVGVLHAR